MRLSIRMSPGRLVRKPRKCRCPMNRILPLVILTLAAQFAGSAAVMRRRIRPFPGERGADLDTACRARYLGQEGRRVPGRVREGAARPGRRLCTLHARSRRAEDVGPVVSAAGRRSPRGAARVEDRRPVARGGQGAGHLSRLVGPLPPGVLGQHARRSLSRSPRRRGDVRGTDSQGPDRPGRHRRRVAFVQLERRSRRPGQRSSRTSRSRIRTCSSSPGDQSYDHKEHTAAWLLWGHQFKEIIKDRPVVTIPDDHDVGHGNLWGEGGIVAESPAGDTGGYFYPAEYIRMVERCQTWHLPDPADPQPVAQGIGTYFTRLRVGGVDFAILEDRKFKTGPNGTIPQMGPRPDHIQEAGYDPKKVDLPELKLLGRSATGLPGRRGGKIGQGPRSRRHSPRRRSAAPFTSTGRPRIGCWPIWTATAGRRRAATRRWPHLRRVLACHLCGDQHLTVVVKHGIDAVSRRSLRLHQPGHHQQLLRPLVVARRRKGRGQSRSPAARCRGPATISTGSTTASR